jgi:hypothetical protein
MESEIIEAENKTAKEIEQELLRENPLYQEALSFVKTDYMLKQIKKAREK